MKSHTSRKGFVSAYRLQAIVEGSQDRKLEAGTEVEAMEKSCLLAFPHSSLSLIITTWGLLLPGVALPIVSLTLPYQTLIKKIPYRLIWWGHFLN